VEKTKVVMSGCFRRREADMVIKSLFQDLTAVSSRAIPFAEPVRVRGALCIGGTPRKRKFLAPVA